MPELCMEHSYAQLMQTNETIQRRGLVYHKTKAGFGPEWHPAVMLHGNGEDKFLMFTTTVKVFVLRYLSTLKGVPQNERMRLQCPVTTGDQNLKSFKEI